MVFSSHMLDRKIDQKAQANSKQINFPVYSNILHFWGGGEEVVAVVVILKWH